MKKKRHTLEQIINKLHVDIRKSWGDIDRKMGHP